MSYYIFGKIQNQTVKFVGCIRTADIPADSILLQTVEHHPDAHWVKWSLRFHRTLTDKKAVTHSYARYFINPARLTRLFGDKDISQFAAEQNAEFLKFHQNNPHFMDERSHAARPRERLGWLASSRGAVHRRQYGGQAGSRASQQHSYGITGYRRCH